MNPVLVKPEGDNRSQVVVLGKPDPELSRAPWRARPARLWPAIESSLRSLGSEYDLLLIEGAGSPAEINLRSTDLANMRVARLARASVLLVADIERGGAFAHLFGTVGLLEPAERALVRGFVLNKFRGDPALLAPGPERLEQLTGIPVVGVVPRFEHGLPDEDGAAPPSRAGTPRARVAVVRYPTASNLDEFKPLEQVADLVWAGASPELAGADLVVLPGSKHVVGDLAWLGRTGLDRAVADRARAGGRVLGICGGLQLLGEAIVDPAGIDGHGRGLGLLPLTTIFSGAKRTRRTSSRFAELEAPWSELSGRAVSGYEIRHGSTHASGLVVGALPDGLGFAAGPVLGIYLHGLFEQPELVEALLGASPQQSLEAELDRLADEVARHLDVDGLLALAGIR
jgi:adenosylcobyric acid synthase